MSTAEVVDMGGSQIVRLPEGIHLETGVVSIRQEGEAVILEPIKPRTWPDGFFEAIRISDPKFVRPEQGAAPPLPSLD
jgi:virulence-associated protein VagC